MVGVGGQGVGGLGLGGHGARIPHGVLRPATTAARLLLRLLGAKPTPLGRAHLLLLLRPLL